MMHTAARMLYARGESLAAEMAVSLSGKPRIAVINGLPDPMLATLAAHAGEFVVQQTRRDHCLDLQRAGHTVRRSLEGQAFDIVLVPGGKQREQTLGWISAGLDLLDAEAPHGGTLLFAAANDMGAKGYEKRMAELGAPLGVGSKAKCRVVQLHGADIAHPEAAEAWRVAAAPRRLDDGIISCPGVFSWDRADAGSRLLLEYLPGKLFEGLKGARGLDLGCGNGYLSMHVLERYAGFREWHVVDVEELALDCARRNLAGLKGCSVHAHWLDATRETLPGGMDVVLLNPPFHKDKADNNALGQSMIEAAARSLRPGGSLLLVANRHLPYELLLYETFGQIRVLYEGQGYKVIRCEMER